MPLIGFGNDITVSKGNVLDTGMHGTFINVV
jgi:hypothetical protein